MTEQILRYVAITVAILSIALDSPTRAHAKSEPETPPAEAVEPEAASGDALPASPEVDELARRATLLEDIYHAVASERTQHERLITGYQNALRRARELGREDYVDTFLLGLANAHALAFDQTGKQSQLDLLTVVLDDLDVRLRCRAERQSDDDIQLEDAHLLRTRRKLPPPPPPPCRADPAGQTTAPPIDPPRPKAAPPKRVRTDLVLLGTGGAAGVTGLTLLLVGALGGVIANGSDRLADPPTANQQDFLDHTLPRNRAIWISIGATTLAAGIAMMTAGGIFLRRRQAGRRAAFTPGRGFGALTFRF